MSDTPRAVRGRYIQQVFEAAERLRADLGAGRSVFPLAHIVRVNAGEEGDVEPEELIIIVELGYGEAVRQHFAANPIPIGPAPADLDSGAPPGTLGIVVAEQHPDPIPRPHNLDPTTMVGGDVDNVAEKLLADGWVVRRIEDGDPITMDYNEDRANLYHHSRTDQVAYKIDIG